MLKILLIFDYLRLLFRNRFSGVKNYEFVSKLKERFSRQDFTSNFDRVENIRQDLLSDNRLISVCDFGQGPRNIQVKSSQQKPYRYKRQVGDIAKHSLKNQKECCLIAHIIELFNPEIILELGTSFGITTSYISTVSNKSKITTIEGCSETANIAINTFNRLGFENIDVVINDFDNALQSYFKSIDKIDFAIIDGNHSYEAVNKYFGLLAQQMSDNAVIVIDDIRWSEGMRKAWMEIQKRPEVTLSIDFFQIGVVLFNKALVKEKVFIRF